MELRQLRYFVTVAETLHFGRAAELLHIVQPAVSQQIRRLERELGAALFDRSPRRVAVTDVGRAFLPAAREVLAAADRARAVADRAARPGRRTLRVGTSTGLGDHLDRVLERLAAAAAHLDVDLVSAPVGERLAQVAEGRLDAAFVRGEVRHPGVRAVPVWTDELLAAVSARGPGGPVEPAELRDMRLMLTARRNHPALVDLVTGACAAAGFEPRPGPPAGTLQDTLAAIGAGDGLWTVVYAAHARMLNTTRVAFRPFAPPGLALPTSLAVAAAGPDDAVEALLAAAADRA
ncbi:LysR family transcriptional regulator [Dactylosporangium vinaceum]|uniref:LysR substrate-binding domain-containing protein n=1 Tax=Dactylosporangium vinaceum TaxID=53362 RepID=A0ABV5MDW8_9ACTN|nr:LysR family transcriptional regulator [Dactylosporangium vinaceum]UAC01037.1 LysR family transcriptional regulator [Dactylosporangium vinaceum]